MCLEINFTKSEDGSKLLLKEEIKKSLRNLVFSSAKIATNDIVVIKDLQNNGKSKLQNFKYEIGKTYLENKFIEGDLDGKTESLYYKKEQPNSFYIPRGFENMILKELKASKIEKQSIDEFVKSNVNVFAFNYGFHSWDVSSYEAKNSGNAKFIIPSGSLYFEKAGVFCSNCITYVSPITLEEINLM
ncbi:MAG: hypothetical protein ABIP51_01065 [Bacteroidia bacterium]